MNTFNITKQKGFQFQLGGASKELTIESHGYLAMRGWQRDAFNELNSESFMILNAPMGSGKSLFHKLFFVLIHLFLNRQNK